MITLDITTTFDAGDGPETEMERVPCEGWPDVMGVLTSIAMEGRNPDTIVMHFGDEIRSDDDPAA